MATLLSGQGLTKSFSARPLFREISFGIQDGDRIGLIGPNGSGKSTLLKILAGFEKPDEGTVSRRTGLRIGFVPQDETFPAGMTVAGVLTAAIAGEPVEAIEREMRVAVALAMAGFEDEGIAVATSLSGGWRKRLSIARALITEPDLMLLDEPTNHLDLQGVMWLEETLKAGNFAYFLISHDRAFLENIARRVIELNAAYPGGYFGSDGAYSDFLIKRDEFLAAQAHQQVALQSVVRREIEWLRRGAQARSTKAKGRIDQAGRLIEDLGELKFRNAQAGSSVGDMAFSASGRRTKEMVVLKDVAKTMGERQLFEHVDLIVSPGRRMGIVGENGSGKTTLLRIITGDLTPDTGTIRRADRLQTIWFDQERRQDMPDPDVTLRDALSPNGDTVAYRDGNMHVSAWAKRFLFRADQLSQPIGSLSGGERARVLIARLMLQSADLLILDEPTNDLDIPTLEVLEESLTTFPGAVLLVTHDRYLLDRVSTEIVGLMGDETVRTFADYDQWADARRVLDNPPAPAKAAKPAAPVAAPVAPRPVALTTSERRELEKMEATIAQAETHVADAERLFADSTVASDATRLQAAWSDLQARRDAVTALYARWETLEAQAGR